MPQSLHVNIFGQGGEIRSVLSLEEVILKMLTQQLRLESCWMRPALSLVCDKRCSNLLYNEDFKNS